MATIGAPASPVHVKKLLREEIPTIQSEGSATVELAGRPFQIQKQFLDDLDEVAMSDDLSRLDAAVLVLHSPVDEIVGIDHARRIYEAARGYKSFVTLADADHLLSDRRDAEYVADVLAAWAGRYLRPDA